MDLQEGDKGRTRLHLFMGLVLTVAFNGQFMTFAECIIDHILDGKGGLNGLPYSNYGIVIDRFEANRSRKRSPILRSDLHL